VRPTIETRAASFSNFHAGAKRKYCSNAHILRKLTISWGVITRAALTSNVFPSYFAPVSIDLAPWLRLYVTGSGEKSYA
jgi:hypothetical protein